MYTTYIDNDIFYGTPFVANLNNVLGHPKSLNSGAKSLNSGANYSAGVNCTTTQISGSSLVDIKSCESQNERGKKAPINLYR